ncbi:Inactive leucine-rich repeat receptor-like serine/threonine-protein kinase At1g60630 [Linum perenne]
MEPLVSIRLLFFFFAFLFFSVTVRSADSEALLALKSAVDPSNSLPWLPSTARNVCDWEGVKQCMNGRVTKLVIEFRNLSGVLDSKTLNQLDQLRVLSFKSNSISGQIPDLSGLVNLKSLFLNDNNFSGEFPESITGLHRLKVVVLAGNRLSGPIPSSVLSLDRLYVLYLEENEFTGSIPPLGQTSLRYFNVSGNRLSGSIPVTPALIRFNSSSFSGNVGLCGEQIRNPCSQLSPSPSPSSLTSSKSKNRRSKLIKIIAPAAAGLLILILLAAAILICLCRRNRTRKETASTRSVPKDVAGESASGGGGAASGGSGTGGNNGGRQGAFSWERGESIGTLVFLGAGDQIMSYSLEDLLKASAETLGRGTMGSTYKAVMESGFIVTVKRLKDARYPRVEDFRRQMEVIGRLRHPNLVPLRAYFQAKEERLLVYDYFPNGSLFSLLHEVPVGNGAKVGELPRIGISNVGGENPAGDSPVGKGRDEEAAAGEGIGRESAGDGIGDCDGTAAATAEEAGEMVERTLTSSFIPKLQCPPVVGGGERTRASGGGKPLHWTSCLKIAEDLATGILYIHQNHPGLTHGNLKSSNVLLGPDFESCITDFGLAAFQNPDSPDEPSAAALFYRAPEVRGIRKLPTQPADVYSFGVLLLELLTGKTPFQDLVQEHGSDIPRWVRSVREEETDSGDDPVSSGNEAEEKLQALVGVAMQCVSRLPENRPAMREVLKMIRDARSSEGGGGGQVSSNSNHSSDHSPGRWSDTVQSLPRDEHLSI